MLSISNQTLPDDEAAYLAFRVACLETLERIVLAGQFGPEASEGFGYLTEVPFLRAVPPQVQIDLLAETWHKHVRRERHEATLVDEAVLFGVCETAARIAAQEPDQFWIWCKSNPRRCRLPSSVGLAARIRHVHLDLPNEGDFLLVSQLEDLPPVEALGLKAEFGMEPRRVEELIDVLGRWHASPQLAYRLIGLLTEREIAQAVGIVTRAARGRKIPQQRL
jgi:hypothetical protein